MSLPLFLIIYLELKIKEKNMNTNTVTPELSEQSLNQLFIEARSHHAWQAKPLEDVVLRKLYDLAKWGPTSVNSQPARLVFVKSKEAKERLIPALQGGNVAQVQAAPVTVIVAHDERFYDHLPVLFPAFDAKSMFAANEAMSRESAFRNGTLQGAYLMLAARSLGLDVGPMSGFDNAKVDEAFFKGTSWKSNFLFNVGYGDLSKAFPRGPRLSFEQAARID
jgi:3-hydroxypropanoate dehydrogenase